jgi:N-acetylneuraminic acid mutarotase
VVNGILYVIGGNSTISGATDVVEAYDPAKNSWSEKAPLPIADAPVAAVDGGSIYAIGGYSSGSGRLANVYRYNPKTNAWSVRQPLKLGRSNPGVATISGKIIIADGITNSGVTTEAEKYAPKTNRWKVVQSDLTARTAGCSGVAGSDFYLAGGELGGGSAPDTNILDVYDSKAGTWSAKANMPQATVAPGYATVNGLVYCIGGASSGNPAGATFYDTVQVYNP